MITFSTSLSETVPLNSYNNNVVSFTSDTVGTLVLAEITFSGVTIQLTPDVNGVFTYNFIEIFKAIINDNYFRDEIDGLSLVSPYFIIEDTDLFKELVISYKVIFDNDDEETTSKTYKLLKSVIQLEDHRKGLINSNNPNISILLPFTQASSQTYHASYFTGFPFDFSLYSDAARTIKIKDVNTLHEVSVPVVEGVNRVFWSVGGTDWTLEDELPMIEGVNEFEISFVGQAPEEVLTLFMTKYQDACGTLLKWFNNSGAWSYFLFNELEQARKVKSLGEFEQDFENVEDTSEVRTNYGSEQQDSVKLYAVNLDINQKKQLNSIIGSPKIYRYLNDSFQEMTSSDWISEGVKDGTFKTEKTNRNSYEFELTLEKNKANTITL